MEFFHDQPPSTSQSKTKNQYDEEPLMTEDLEHDSTSGHFSGVAVTEMQEQSSSFSSSIADIRGRVQDLVEKINESRSADQNMIASFQEEIVEKVIEMCQQMKEHVYMAYAENGKEMQVKLQELSKVLGSCSKLNQELNEASNALASLRDGLPVAQTPEP